MDALVLIVFAIAGIMLLAAGVLAIVVFRRIADQRRRSEFR